MQKAIMGIVRDVLVAALQKAMIDDVPQGDSSRLGKIVIGDLQDAIPDFGVVLSYYPGGTPKPDRKPKAEDDWTTAPPLEIGGGGFRIKYCRFVVDVFLGDTGQFRAEADDIAETVYSRLATTINALRPSAFAKDDFGESVMAIHVADMWRETGGEETSIHDGEVVIQILTHFE